ncbi:MAG: hypothetical protein GTN97_03505, partial [Nitrosopumilaceae archaeon]|nr:hypothetical protein [Nitrosopumilaceae archaeon]NIP09333.1 hypothetical protein [Nitrosopumilaceae archaeon]NIS94976.1 hypothetical protein [Nitrosopumilaceae archaeon]
MNSKIFFLSVAVLFLLVVSLSSDVVFADKPDKENFKENREEAKAERQSDREEAKAERQSDRE